MSSELKQQIEESIAGSPVHVFMKGTPEWPQCGFSKATCDAFRSIGVPFTATNVLDDLDKREPPLKLRWKARSRLADHEGAKRAITVGLAGCASADGVEIAEDGDLVTLSNSQVKVVSAPN